MKSVIELGCYDAKTIHFLPDELEHYTGYDANWENGLEIGRKLWADDPRVELQYTDHPDTFNQEYQKFDISICMETLEHLPLITLENFIRKLQEATRTACYITVPNERGLVFLLKYLVKRISGLHVENYQSGEVVAATLGKMSAVRRNEGGHKGFDYQALIRLLNKYFMIRQVSGIPFALLGPSLSFSLGMVCIPKTDNKFTVSNHNQ